MAIQAGNVLRRVAMGWLLVSGLACTATDESLPPDIQDPASLHTPAGAMARYQGALTILPQVFDGFLTRTGILTDELADLPAPLFVGGAYTSLDSRQDLSAFTDDYARLHNLRVQAREARGFLQAYADSSRALVGHLYAEEGYGEIWLAELFCSGIPLSTVDFNGDYTLAAGSSTADVYRHAITLFDSAMVMASDSVRFQHFAAVGRGRALLALGRYAEAAAAVAGVPDTFTYRAAFPPENLRLLSFFVTAPNPSTNYQSAPATPSVGNNEGGTGLDYRTSGDPRVPVKAVGQDANNQTLWFPANYDSTTFLTLTIANGIEARLIEAEAALQAGSDWLTKLNMLRTDGTQDGSGVYNPGTGGVAGLAPLEDPGATLSGPAADAARVDLLFRERAFWLYLTGHRQGDLRRLIREYHRDQNAVYPSGTYPGGSGSYGAEVVVPVPQSEQELNTKYTGCVDHRA